MNGLCSKGIPQAHKQFVFWGTGLLQTHEQFVFLDYGLQQAHEQVERGRGK